MATRKEILEANLPAEVAEKAVRHATAYWGEDELNRYPKFSNSPKWVLSTAFVFASTPEGQDYWRDVANNLEKSECDE